MAFIMSVTAKAQAYTDDELGFSVDIDESYQLSRQYDVARFKSADSDNVVIIKNWPGLTPEMARDYLLSGYQNDVLAIVASGDVNKQQAENGTGLRVDVMGVFQRKLVKGLAAAYIGDDGQGIVLLAVAAEPEWTQFESEANKIAASVVFKQPSTGPDARDWYYMLAGKSLSFRGESSDTRRREVLNLCSDNGFTHRLATSSMEDLDTGSSFGFSSKSKSGYWEVVDVDGGSVLVLHYGDGSEESALIEDKDGRFYLDGRRYAITRSHHCR
jgi:hypothetical protein